MILTDGACRTIIGNPDGTFLWLQAYIDEYSLGTWMQRSKQAGINPMSAEELRRRLKLLHVLDEDAEAWDDKADDIYNEVVLGADALRGFIFARYLTHPTIPPIQLFGVRVNARKERLNARHYKHWDRSSWKGGRVSFALSCTWPLHVPQQPYH